VCSLILIKTYGKSGKSLHEHFYSYGDITMFKIYKYIFLKTLISNWGRYIILFKAIIYYFDQNPHIPLVLQADAKPITINIKQLCLICHQSVC